MQLRFGAAAQHAHHDVLADRRLGDEARQVLELDDVLAVELQDDVALVEHAVGRAGLGDVDHQRAVVVGAAEALRRCRR